MLLVFHACARRPRLCRPLVLPPPPPPTLDHPVASQPPNERSSPLPLALDALLAPVLFPRTISARVSPVRARRRACYRLTIYLASLYRSPGLYPAAPSLRRPITPRCHLSHANPPLHLQFHLPFKPSVRSAADRGTGGRRDVPAGREERGAAAPNRLIRWRLSAAAGPGGKRAAGPARRRSSGCGGPRCAAPRSAAADGQHTRQGGMGG